MKIFVCSDLHGNYEIMRKIKNYEAIVDAIFICGDIGGKDIHGKTLAAFGKYQKKYLSALEKELSSLTKPSRYILGNDDWFEADGEHYLMHKETLMGYEFLPFEFTPITPFSTNREVNENKMAYELNKLDVNNNAVVIAHAPPYGIGDRIYSGKNCGSKAIRNWIEQNQPLVWVNGHIHEDSRYDYIGKTLVVNCSCDYRSSYLEGYIIDLEDMSITRV